MRGIRGRCVCKQKQRLHMQALFLRCCHSAAGVYLTPADKLPDAIDYAALHGYMNRLFFVGVVNDLSLGVHEIRQQQNDEKYC